MIQRGDAGGSHRTCGNVYVEHGFFAIPRGVRTERVGTYAYRGAFPHLGGRVAWKVSERVVFIRFMCFSRQGCTERVGT